MRINPWGVTHNKMDRLSLPWYIRISASITLHRKEVSNGEKRKIFGHLSFENERQ